MSIVHSILLLGPSGTGKSSFGAQAAKALGGAAIVGAPGDDEKNSYIHLLDSDPEHFRFDGFDDYGWMPSIGMKEADGLKRLLQHLQELYKESAKLLSAGEKPRYPLLIIDTFSAISRMAFNASLAKFNRTEAPKARGDDGAPFYGTLSAKMDEVMRMARAIRGLGVHLIVTSHVNERENVSEAAAAVVSSKMLVPAVSGGFRDVLPSFFDGVFFTEVKSVPEKPSQHFLRWKPSTKRPSKSRLGDLLGNGQPIANDWSVVSAAMNAAIETRKAA